jgi:hypothetical protein
MISQQRIDELLFSEPNMVRIIRQVEIEATEELRERAERAEASERPLLQMRDELLAENAALRAERDALRALLAELRRLEQWRDDDDRELMACRARVDAKLRDGK